MLIFRLDPAAIERVPFGSRSVEADFICACVHAREIDKAFMDAEAFFNYMGWLWRQSAGCHPNNIVEIPYAKLMG